MTLLQDWFSSNNLKLNIEKTKGMIFQNHYRKNRLIDNTSINRSNNILTISSENNFLGITLHQKLSWKNHIHIITKKT